LKGYQNLPREACNQLSECRFSVLDNRRAVSHKEGIEIKSEQPGASATLLSLRQGRPRPIGFAGRIPPRM